MIIDWKENAEHLDNMAIHEYTINFFFFYNVPLTKKNGITKANLRVLDHLHPLRGPKRRWMRWL